MFLIEITPIGKYIKTEVIKAFGKAQKSYERFEVAAKEGADCYVEWMRRCNVFFCIAMVLAPCTSLAVVPVGGMF